MKKILISLACAVSIACALSACDRAKSGAQVAKDTNAAEQKAAENIDRSERDATHVAAVQNQKMADTEAEECVPGGIGAVRSTKRCGAEVLSRPGRRELPARQGQREAGARGVGSETLGGRGQQPALRGAVGGLPRRREPPEKSNEGVIQLTPSAHGPRRPWAP